jgi:hypothetical protein
MTNTRKGRWQAGQSGNPHGRPKGSSETSRLRNAIAESIPEIIEELVIKAKSGDVAAARLLFERALPALKPVDATIQFPMPDESGLTAQAQTVAHAIASGALPINQGAALLASLTAIARLKEVDEIEARIAKLEKSL